MLRIGYVAALCVALAGCVTTDGPNPALKDFGRDDALYERLPVDRLYAGMAFAEVRGMFGARLKAVGSQAGSETYSVDRWGALPGVDAPVERLFLKVTAGRVEAWRVHRVDELGPMSGPPKW